MSPEDSRWITWGEDAACISTHCLHHCRSPRRPRACQLSALISCGQSAPLAMAASPPPRGQPIIHFQGPCFSSPSLAQHPRLFLFFFLFSTSSKCGCTQGFNPSRHVFSINLFPWGVSSIFSFSPHATQQRDLKFPDQGSNLCPLQWSRGS